MSDHGRYVPSAVRNLVFLSIASAALWTFAQPIPRPGEDARTPSARRIASPGPATAPGTADEGRTDALLALAILVAGAGGAAGGGASASSLRRRRTAAIRETAERLAGSDRRQAAAQPRCDLSRLDAAVRAMGGRISHAEAERRLATAMLAHDLRAPLVRLRARLVAALTGRTTRDDVERAVAHCDDLAELLTSLLSISALEGGGRRLRTAPLGVRDLLATIVEAYEPAVEDGGRTLRSIECGNGGTMDADRSLMMQALGNLLDNAQLHTPPGTTVTVSSEVGGGKVRISVTDDGPGASPEDAARLGEPFFRASGERRPPGHGLGLAMAAAIARAHGGLLEVECARPGLRVSLVVPSAV